MLNVRVLGVEKPELLVVLCHGFGAPGDDLVAIGAELLTVAPELAPRVAFAFPEAPLAMGPFGRAWWEIDFPRLEAAVRRADFDAMFDDVPQGMAEARVALEQALAALTRELGVPMSRVVLGGFSQGAMIATDVTLHAKEPPAALVLLSGFVLNRRQWQALAPQRKGLPVFQSHGTEDPLLPYSAALALKGILDDAGLATSFVSFRGGHGFDMDVIEKLAAFIKARLS